MNTLLLCMLVYVGGVVWTAQPEQGQVAERLRREMPVEIRSGTMIRVYDVEAQQLREMDLEQYLTGVVAAEMPAGFDLEALKAQAVAARTFAVNRMEHSNPKVTELDPRAQITTSPEICQAWVSAEEQQSRWGNNYTLYAQKVAEAVQDTAGQVLQYQGQLAEPLYHASCGGNRTEDVKNVWGNAVPYLVSVACPHGADKHTQEETVFTLADFSQRLGLEQASIPTGAFGDYIAILASTASDRVKEIRVGNEVMTGGQLRTKLGLKSSLFSYQVQGDEIIFHTNGYGHGVGMCQYGADYYAQQGYDYQQILAHYYPGTELTKH